MKQQELDIKGKVDYVIKATGLGKHTHTCHYPGCFAIVKPQFWGCMQHWYSLPRELRAMIWATYTPGKEIKKNPSPAYIAVAEKVQIWIIAIETWKTVRSLMVSGYSESLGVDFHPL